MSTQATTKVNKKGKVEKDRLGSAITSMILGIIAATFVFLAIVIEVLTYGNTNVGATFATIAGILSLIGFPLGLMARKSSKGRGMAIAGIVLTALPFLFILIAIIMTVVMAILFAF